MPARITSISLPDATYARLRAEAEETGLKASTIMKMALLARWAAQDASQGA